MNLIRCGKLLLLFLWPVFYLTPAIAQHPDTTVIISDSLPPDSPASKKRMRIVTLSHAGLYAGSMVVLNQAWYADYKRTGFHTFNDWPEWQQVDKVGHTWSAYQLSRASAATWQWAGASQKQQVWLGALSGFTFLTVIETLDAFSDKWGWSWGDFAANVSGSALYAGQQLAWQEQRIGLKFSFHAVDYNTSGIEERVDDLYGSTLMQRMLKDYNGQTYWLSANLKSFFPESRLPAWLNVAVGYGAEGMLGGRSNEWIDKNGQAFNRNDIGRIRQFYLAPDIDFTRIRVKQRWLKPVLFCLNAFKMPAPALIFSNKGVKLHAFYF